MSKGSFMNIFFGKEMKAGENLFSAQLKAAIYTYL
jgi:hypothetical protein